MSESTPFSYTPETPVMEMETPPMQTEIPTEITQDIHTKRRFLPKMWQKIVVVVLLVVIALGATAATMAFYTYTVAQQLKGQVADIQVSAHAAYDQFKTQNLPGTTDGLKVVAGKLKTLRQTYTKLAFYDALPIAHNYYQDGIHGLNAADAGVDTGLKSLDAVTPYADVLGFKGQGSFTGGTAEDRLKLILETLQKVTPSLDGITADLQKVNSELAMIDPKRYPENFQGKPLRSYIQQGQDVSKGAVTALTQFRPAITQIPDAAGATGQRKKYFILFQNDKELRPTGGFWTAYSIVFVENGKVTPDKSDDIYALDKKFTEKLPIPPILGKYLTTEKTWHLRDMNTEPDFKESIQTFLQHYQKVPDEPHDIDGVITVDTHVLTDLLKVLGPVDVEGYGTFTAENDPSCGCAQIIHALSEITDKPTPFIKVDRKGILGPMMRTILSKAYTAPKTVWPQLFQTAWDEVQGRHVQMYFFDQKSQDAAELLNAAGRMTRDPKAQDFLAVVDANLGGSKSNLFITSSIKQEVTAPTNGKISKTVTITYVNNHKGDNCNLEAGQLCLNSTDRSWFRAYLPLGSQMTNTQGLAGANQYDQGDFTIIEGTYTLEPMSQSKIILNYTVPYTDTKTYRVKLWKQGGVDSVAVEMDVTGGQEKLTLDKDTVYETAF